MQLVDGLYLKLIAWIERCLQSKLWYLWLLLVPTSLAVITAFPEYRQLKAENKFFELQSAHPLTPQPWLNPTTHESKRAFRLVPPVIAHFSGLSFTGIIILQQCLGVAFFAFVYYISRDILRDNVAAFLVVLCFAQLYPGQQFFCLISNNFDGFGYLVLAAIVLVRSLWLVPALVVVGCFCDERIVCALPMVWLFVAMTKDRPYLLKWSLMCIIGGVVTFLIRRHLHLKYGLSIPLGESAVVGLGVLIKSYTHVPYALLSAFEAFGMLFALVLLGLVSGKAYGQVFMLLAASACFAIPAFCVDDHTRSLGYGYPLIFVLLFLARGMPGFYDLRKMLSLLLVLCALIPATNVVTNVIFTYPPIIPKVLFWFF